MENNNWVSVEEYLPNDGEKRYGIDVLAVIVHYSTTGNSRRSIRIIAFKDGDWSHSPSVKIGEKMFQKVTHWMYLPKYPNKHKPFKIKEIKNGNVAER